MPFTSSYTQIFRDAFIGKPGAVVHVDSMWLGLYSFESAITAFGETAPVSGELPVGSYGYARVPLTPDFFDQSQQSMGMYVNTAISFPSITAPATWKLRGFALYDSGSGGNVIYYSQVTSGPTYYGFDSQMVVLGNRTPAAQPVVFPVGSLRFDFISDESSIGSVYKWGFKTVVSTNVANRFMQAIFLNHSFAVSSVYIGLAATGSATTVASEADFNGYSRVYWPYHRWERQCVNSQGLYDPTVIDTPGLNVGLINRLPVQWRCFSLGTYNRVWGVMLYGFINGASPALELFQSDADREVGVDVGPPGAALRTDGVGDVIATRFPISSLTPNSATGGMSYSTITINVGSLFIFFR